MSAYCIKSANMKITTEDFIFRAKAIHGDKYDYSKVEYTKSSNKICIIFPIHGEFLQSPHHHCNRMQGCPKCGENSRSNKNRSLVEGFGINDCDVRARSILYTTWSGILHRCYSPKWHKKYPTYIGCSVCDEWLYLSNFKEWFDKNYVEGYQLDKDILVKGNKVYSPETCCFVPREINSIYKGSKREYDLPEGVYTSKEKYRSTIKVDGKYEYIGTFDNPEEAHRAYVKRKNEILKELSKRYFEEGKISEKVFNSMINYEFE